MEGREGGEERQSKWRLAIKSSRGEWVFRRCEIWGVALRRDPHSPHSPSGENGGGQAGGVGEGVVDTNRGSNAVHPPLPHSISSQSPKEGAKVKNLALLLRNHEGLASPNDEEPGLSTLSPAAGGAEPQTPQPRAATAPQKRPRQKPEPGSSDCHCVTMMGSFPLLMTTAQ